MLSLYKICAVALYEFKTLKRSWFFRIFSFLAIAIIISVDFLLLVYNRYPFWSFRCIPSSIPYLNMMLLNIFQAVIVIFLATDFLAHDKKTNSIDAIYTRSMTNAEYVIGKSIGVFLLFICLNAVSYTHLTLPTIYSV